MQSELTSSTLDGLSLLSESKKRITDDQLDRILETVVKSIGRTAGSEAGDNNLTTGEEKLTCLSIMHLFATTARSNVELDEEVIRIDQTLTDCGLEKEKRRKIVQTYCDHRNQLVERLDGLRISSVQLPSFKNITWSRETFVASSDLTVMSDPETQFLISIKHDSGSIDMTADADDVQEMMHGVRECCKMIEGINRKSKK